MTSSSYPASQRNRLLASLRPESVKRLAQHLQPADLELHDTLFRPGDETPDVYFPLSGMVSLIAVLSEGEALETGVVGREGMVPVAAYLGVERAQQQGLVQATGEALRVSVGRLRECAREDLLLHELLGRYAAAMLLQTTQVAVCNGLHPVEERLARWLLLAHDRTDGDALSLTHEFLGLMLGVRRASVTTTSATLQRAGLIRSRYGRIEILNRAGLESASCECYARMRQATEDVFS